MKMLILSLGILSSSFAQANVTDQALSTKFVATLQDFKVQGQLEESSEFKQCREEAIKAGKGKQPEDIAELAGKCLEGKIKDPKKASELAENMKLVEYGLVPSKNLKDVTAYIGNKIYKSLTGVDRNDPVEKYMEKTKFKNMTHVDQADFQILYKSQMAKNALFTVSAFCLNDLRKKGSSEADPQTTFWDYWNSDLDRLGALGPEHLSDNGYPKFTEGLSSKKDKKSEYEGLISSLGVKNFDQSNMQKFFEFCSMKIVDLCKAKTTGNHDHLTGRACIVQANLQGIRKAFADSEVIWQKYNEGKTKSTLSLGDYLTYNPSTAKKEDSVDAITSLTTASFVQDAVEDKNMEECIANPEMAKCEAYLADGKATKDSVDNLAINLEFKKEIEVKKVAALKDEGLRKYLETNGYLDLLSRMDDPNEKLSSEDISKEIGEIYEAKKEASLAAVRSKVGKRQTEETDEVKKGEIKRSAAEFKDEKTRLAQVVLFNNIITSQLSLQKKNANGTFETVGQNRSGLDAEIEVVETETKEVDKQYFSNLKGGDGKKPASTSDGNTNIAEIGFLDAYLGKVEKPTTGKTRSPSPK